jgi:hypothetical protein
MFRDAFVSVHSSKRIILPKHRLIQGIVKLRILNDTNSQPLTAYRSQSARTSQI